MCDYTHLCLLQRYATSGSKWMDGDVTFAQFSTDCSSVSNETAHAHMHARTHARTHPQTTHTHTRTHAHTVIQTHRKEGRHRLTARFSPVQKED